MRRTLGTVIVPVLLCATFGLAISQERRRKDISVTIWDTGKRAGALIDLQNRDGWQLAAPGAAADYPFKGDVVLENERLQAVFLSKTGAVTVYSKSPDTKERKRMRVSIVSARHQVCETLGPMRIAENTGGEAVLDMVGHCADGETVRVSFRLGQDRAFIEIAPLENAEAVRIAYRSRFLVIPEFFGDDTVFDAIQFSGTTLRLPSEGLLLSFLEGEESILISTWPLGRSNRVEASLSGESKNRIFEDLEISFNGKGLFAALLDAPGIWHIKQVDRAECLDRDLPADWEKPFEAKWRADFCAEDGTDSWEFEPERKYSWSGRFARRITFPCWFDGNKALLRLIGREYLGQALIYPTERTRTTPLNVYALDDIMRETLGVGPCEYVLDKRPGERRLYLKGGVCDSTGALLHFFLRGIETAEPKIIGDLVDDAVDLITRSRERIEEYRAFGKRVRDLCRVEQGKSASRKTLGDKLTRWAMDIEKVCGDEREKMKTPKAAADFGAQIKELTKRNDPENLGRCMALCRELRVIQSSHEVILARVRKAVSRIRQLAGIAAAGDSETAPVGENVRKLERQMIRGKESR